MRDLSGAITFLQRSLKFNKENIDARNLLGLCYYETGEVVSALCEWVVSKNMSPRENAAERYIADLQNNKNQLDAINQSIRKYNQSIEYCREGHEDMAIMQLKKVVQQNPKLVKAQQLLALLYMKNQDYEKARRMLRKAASVDNTNTTTLRYLSELEEIKGRKGRSRRKREEPSVQENATLRYLSGNDVVIQPTTFRDSSTVATFINIGLGILLGGAIIWFMAVPASRQRIQEQANQAVTDANLKLASGNSQLQDLQDQIEDYQAQINAANQERDEALSVRDSYNDLLGVANLYVQGQQTAAVDAIGLIKEDDLEGTAKELYTNILNGVSSQLFYQYYTAGTTAYASYPADYRTAAEQLELAVAADPDGQEANYYYALYYLGFAYFNLGDTDNADRVFNDLIEKYPNQASAIKPYISSGSGGSASSSGTGEVTQGEAAMNQDQTSQTGGAGSAPAYDPALVAWTDPNTGLHYDMYGNLLDTVQDTAQSTQSTPGYDPSLVAWTDPSTGLHYDMYGNLLG